MFSQEVTQPVLVLLNAKNLQRKETAKKKQKKPKECRQKNLQKASIALVRPGGRIMQGTRRQDRQGTCIHLGASTCRCSLAILVDCSRGLARPFRPSHVSFFFFHKCVIREHPGTHSLLSASHPPYQTGSVGFRQYPLENIYTKQSAVVWCPQSPVNGLHISWLINPRQELFVPG